MDYSKIILLVVLSITIVCNIILLLKSKGSLLTNVGQIFLFYWIINILFAFLIFRDTIDWNISGLVLLLIYVDIFYFSYNCSPLYSEKRKIIYSSSLNNGILLKSLILFSFFCGCGYVVIELNSNGFSLANLFSFDGLLESGMYFTDGRYGGRTEIVVPLSGQILLMINYAGFCFSGYLFRLNLIKRYFCFLQFIPMMASTLSTTAKTMVISGIILWVTGYILACLVDESYLDVKIKINYKKLIIPILIICCIFYLSFVIRYRDNDSIAIINRLFIYTFGHVPCFDTWFKDFNVNLFGYSLGQQSFQAVFGPEMPLNLVHEYVVPYLETSYGWTNVNTMFAYVLMDFGYFGSAIFFVLFGRIARLAHNSIQIKGSPIGHAVLGLAIYEILYSFLISAMKYKSIIGAFVVFGLYIFIMKRKK